MPKIFGTDGIRCKVNQEPMTPETCLKIAKTTGYLLSNKKAKKLLKWKPKISMEKGLRLTYEWAIKNDIGFSAPFKRWYYDKNNN